MVKELVYRGYSTVPSDYECSDGQSACSLNVISEDGHLRGIGRPQVLFSLPDGSYKPVYVHKIAAEQLTLYIIRKDSGEWFWGTEKEEDSSVVCELHEIEDLNGVEALSVCSMGNTLIVLSSMAPHYLLWQGGVNPLTSTANGYKYLGSSIPELRIRVGLEHPGTGRDMSSVSEGVTVEYEDNQLTETSKINIINAVLSAANSVVEEAHSRGYIVFPMFLRYAYRMYDGTLTGHSAPILLLPHDAEGNQIAVPTMEHSHVSGKEFYRVRVKPSYIEVCRSGALPDLSGWRDIITGVEFYLSQPIYTYYQDPDKEAKDEMIHRGVNSLRVELPLRSLTQIQKDICECGRFYLVKSYKLDEFSEAFGKSTTLGNEPQPFMLNISDEGKVRDLATRPLMTDDFMSHDLLTGYCSFVYNNRLTIGGVRRSLYHGYSPECMTQYETQQSVICPEGDSSLVVKAVETIVTVHLRINGTEYKLSRSYEGDLMPYASVWPKSGMEWDDPRLPDDNNESRWAKLRLPAFVYYPDVNAYKMTVHQKLYYAKDESEQIIRTEIPLTAHPVLNGAYAYLKESIRPLGDPRAMNVNAEVLRDMPEKLYTSEAENPFVFAARGVTSVGTGRVIALSTSARALSQGQYGQFPLYAFTTDGVWALEVGSTGAYVARQPITRDVCIDANSVTQLDTAVLFATDRGLMYLSGAQTECITDGIGGEYLFDVDRLPGVKALRMILGEDAFRCLPTTAFSKYLLGCSMTYDYVHQRVIVYNKEYGYAYVFSLQSKQWGMMCSDICGALNSYPQTLAYNAEGDVVDFSLAGTAPMKGLYVTRPIKLEPVDVEKTVRELVQRGTFRTGSVGSVLWGSRNLEHWYLIGSSSDHYLRGISGTGYKYFRVGVLCRWAGDESLYGVSVNYTPKLTNHLR